MSQSTLFSNALQVLTGGVSSSFRINPYTAQPMYLERANGPFIYDVDGRQYLDFFMGHGACTLGHNRPEILQSLQEALKLGYYAEFDGPMTIELAKKIQEHVPCAERVRYVNSGSEGTLLALRLARGYTGRTKIVRIDGHFHGVHDYVLANNLASKIDRNNLGGKQSTIGPLSAGIPEIIRETLYVIPWNEPEVFETLTREHGHEIAAIIMNPIDFNNGCIGTTSEYLRAIRRICDEHGIVFVLDEILSGFRTGLSCGQGFYGVIPDLCLLGKALTNGFPLAAIAGKEKIMAKIMDPVDPVIAGGTFSGNVLGCAAGLAAIGIMEAPGFFDAWQRRVNSFVEGLQQGFDQMDFPARIQHIGCNFFIYVGTREPVTCYHDFAKIDQELARSLFRRCIQKGVYFHTDFTISAQHDDSTLGLAKETILEAASEIKTEAFATGKEL